MFLNPALSCVFLLYCSMARVGHSGMTADEVTENIDAAVQTVVAKLQMVSLLRQNLFYSNLTFQLRTHNQESGLFVPAH